MRKKFWIAAAIFLLLGNTSCARVRYYAQHQDEAKNDSVVLESQNENQITPGSNETEQASTAELPYSWDTLSVYIAGPSDVGTVPIPEACQITEEALTGIDQLENLVCSEDLQVEIGVPDDTTEVFDFLYTFHERPDNSTFLDAFLAMYMQLMGDREMDSTAFRYVGANSKPVFDTDGNLIQDIHCVKDYEDAIRAGTEPVMYLMYDEGMGEQKRDSPCFLQATAPIGNDLFRFNKGKGLARTGWYGSLEIYSPYYSFSVEEICAPDSEAAYELSDGSVRVCDAVRFFETYVNRLYSGEAEDPVMRIKVMQVDVLNIGEGKHGYGFQLTWEHNKIPVEKAMNQQYTTDKKNEFQFQFVLGEGFMLESKDVDFLNANGMAIQKRAETRNSRILPVEEAARVIGGMLTEEVEFEVKSISLQYSLENYAFRFADSVELKNRIAAAPPENHPFRCSLSWCFRLWNENDHQYYHCYVDAATGGNFRYFSTAE